MLLTETDIIVYNCPIYITELENAYEDLYQDKELLDFSNYPKESKYYDK